MTRRSDRPGGGGGLPALEGALPGGRTITAGDLFDRTGSNRFAISTIFILLLVFIGAVAWAAVMPITEVAASSGEVYPSGSVRKVQHLEGGIVSKVLVTEGEHVTKGQTLVEFASNVADSELAQLQTRLAATNLRITLLTGALSDRLPKLDEVDARFRDIAEAENVALTARRESLKSQTAVLSQQVLERKSALASLSSQTSALDQRIGLIGEQIKARRGLAARGFYPRLHVLDDERSLVRLDGERLTLDMNVLRLSESVREAEARVEELQSKFEAELTAEISKLTNQDAELSLAIDRAQDRVTRLDVTAPVSGRVHGLQIRTIGGVIAPGGTLMEIVPDDARPYVEARVSTQDVGFIRPGQEATIKVMTYNYAHYGSIPGKVRQISPSTFMTEDGRPFYKAHIELDTLLVGGNQDMPVGPGMTVVADIITGQKTLLSYLLTPIIRSFGTAFRER